MISTDMNQLDLAFVKAPVKQPRQKKISKSELAVYLEDNYEKIISGNLCAKTMMSDTGWNRATIKKVAIANNLAYKKREKTNYFSVPIYLCNVSLVKR